jgi:hypothetical protein
VALTAAQIVTLSCQIAKTPGFTSQAGQLLNSILSDLSQTYDFDVARGTTIITLTSGANGTDTGSGPYTLPADYLRARYNEVFFTNLGVKYVLISIELAQYDAAVQTAGFQNFPVYFATDMSQSPPVMYVWPPSSGTFPLTVRYQRQMPDIATPETSSTVPWFPNQDYLRQKVATGLMEIANDDRLPAFTKLSDDTLTAYLKLKDDPEGHAQQVQLDRRQFRPGFSNLPVTKLVGW